MVELAVGIVETQQAAMRSRIFQEFYASVYSEGRRVRLLAFWEVVGHFSLDSN